MIRFTLNAGLMKPRRGLTLVSDKKKLRESRQISKSLSDFSKKLHLI
jgi:hypothetical protein